MKMILAFVQPHRIDRVTRAVSHIKGFPGMTVSEARGFGKEKLQGEHDTREQLTDFTPTARIDTVVDNALVEAVLQAVIDSAHTGEHGDGKIFVLPVEQAIRVRTKERGPHVI